jgi:hypothetical protein
MTLCKSCAQSRYENVFLHFVLADRGIPRMGSARNRIGVIGSENSEFLRKCHWHVHADISEFCENLVHIHEVKTANSELNYNILGDALGFEQ